MPTWGPLHLETFSFLLDVSISSGKLRKGRGLIKEEPQQEGGTPCQENGLAAAKGRKVHGEFITLQGLPLNLTNSKM